MLMVLTNEGKVDLLFNAMVAPPEYVMEDWWLDLFTNDVTVAAGSVLSDFDLATFGGYARISITRADFLGVSILDDVGVTGRTAPTSFLCTGSPVETVYGWIMHGKTTGATLAGQNLDTPRVMSNGAELDLDPFNFKLDTLCICAT